MYQEIPLEQTVAMLGSGRTLILTTFDREQGFSDAMAVSWNVPLGETPVRYGFIIRHDARSHGLILKEREFAISLPGARLARMVLKLAEESGRERDKFISCGMDGMESVHVTPPSIHGCLAHVEFKLMQVVELDGASIFIAEAVAARVMEGMFRDGAWEFGTNPPGFLQYHGGNRFGLEEKILSL